MSDAARVEALAAEIEARAAGRARYIVCIAGAPGSGKSTLAEALVGRLEAACLVPMDGFHLDNALLEERGLLARKGAPETFDAMGFLHLLRRLRDPGEVAIPVFDRTADAVRPAAATVTDAHHILLVEGNYLMLDSAPWGLLRPLFDFTVFLDVPEDKLEKRLIRRWLDQGLDKKAARARALGNDIPNARLVARHSGTADLTLR